MTRISEAMWPLFRHYRCALRAGLLLSLLAGGWSCGSRITAPEQRATSDLHFLRTKAGAPPFVSLTGSFYAKRGEDRVLALYYRPLPGAKDSVKFLDFRVPAGALAKAPDGRAYAPGDSVLITVTITDPVRMIVRFQPSGLQFAAERPAQLELSFLEADDDINGDGVVDAQDTALKAQLAVWVQETPGGTWAKMMSALFLDLEELGTDIPGFSGYAVAY